MEKLEYPCPYGGKVQWEKEKVTVEGVDCGILDVEICASCGEQYFPEQTMEVVQDKLKKEGLWGVQKREKLISGNSVLLRLPKEFTKLLHLKPDQKVRVYNEGKKRLVIDI
jgi:hypothetical protein